MTSPSVAEKYFASSSTMHMNVATSLELAAMPSDFVTHHKRNSLKRFQARVVSDIVNPN